MKTFLSIAFLVVTLGLLLTGCGSTSNAKQVPIPSITMECGAGNCKSNSTFFAVMYITAYSCDENSINFSVAASSSESVACTAASGCTETFSDWVNYSGNSTTTVSEGTYNLCGIVANSSFSGAWTGNVRAVGTVAAKKFDGSATTLDVPTWTNF